VKPWIKWMLCVLAVLAVLDAFSFVKGLVSNGRRPTSAASAGCNAPSTEVCFDVIDGLVQERRPSQGGDEKGGSK
jgi:hypothetical protein